MAWAASRWERLCGGHYGSDAAVSSDACYCRSLDACAGGVMLTVLFDIIKIIAIIWTASLLFLAWKAIQYQRGK